MATYLQVGRVGKTLLPWRSEDEQELLDYPERTMLKAKITKPRSGKAHRFYFKVIARAAEHWPHGQDPFSDKDYVGGLHLKDPDKLRAWLQCKAGYYDVIAFPFGTENALARLVQRIRGDGKFCFIDTKVVNKEPAACVFTPTSIAYDEMDETEFRPIREAVFALIEEITGVTAEQLVFETEMSA
jgi:hypothetical protein